MSAAPRERSRPLARIVSGGQTGVDRAALDVALERGVPCGGWCPKGRLAEDGPIAARYPLAETPSTRYAQRTRWNVRDSDATLIVAAGELGGGTAYTAAVAAELGRPCLVVPPDPGEVPRIAAWLAANAVAVLNVAGPRESGSPGIHAAARGLLAALLDALGRSS